MWLVIQRKDTKRAERQKRNGPQLNHVGGVVDGTAMPQQELPVVQGQKEQSEKKTQNTKIKEDTFDASFAIKMTGVRKVQWKSLRLVRAAAGDDHFHICPPIAVPRV